MRRREVMSGSLALGLAAGYGSARASTPAAKDAPAQAIGVPKGGARKGYVDGPFGQIHYYRAHPGAAGAPTLMLLHQSPLSGRQFEQALPLLAQAGIDAIAWDAPGYGNSDTPLEPPSIKDYAAALKALIQGLGLRAVHILGHHTGAQVATAFAVSHPQNVSSVILNRPPYFSDDDLARLASYEHAPEAYSRDGSHLVDLFARRARFSPGWTDERVMHRRLVDQLWAGPEVWYGHHAAFAYDMRPDFMQLEVPTMILTNTGDDIYDLAQVASKARPDLTFVEMQGGTHDIVDEQPLAWANAVARWVLARAS